MPHPLVFKGAGVSSMRNPLQRHYGRGDLHFVTFSCYRRRPFLETRRARDCFVKVLKEVRLRYRFQLLGYVVMPEHVHLLISEPPKANPSKVLQVLKQRVSRTLRRRRRASASQLSLAFGEGNVDAEHFWQRRFYDFNVWSAKKLREKLEYMHANPVQRKLVPHPRDWPWSSWSYYSGCGNGLISIDALGPQKEGRENPHP